VRRGGSARCGIEPPRIATAVAWLRENFEQLVDVDDLGRRVHMSGSNFHGRLKAVTSRSPLQFQTALRLQEARRLMLPTMLEAGAAGRRVGYISASQFTRAYARFFGTPPTKMFNGCGNRASPPRSQCLDQSTTIQSQRWAACARERSRQIRRKEFQ
jgi:transcriptional regulator GlxA family with amidase domain